MKLLQIRPVDKFRFKNLKAGAKFYESGKVSLR